VPGSQRRALTETPACREGRLYIQNPSSMVPVLVLEPQRGEQILDLAAAPGGKTLQLAALVGDQGRVAAVESVRDRFFRLRANLSAGGADRVQTYLKDGAQVWRACPERFDRVLLDAPCSSEGRFTTADPGSYARWSERKIAEMSRKQKRLLFSAVQCLKPGGTLVYSTCTFAPEENELVAAMALVRFAGRLGVEPVRLPFANVQEGLAEWRGKALPPELAGAVRILPDGVMEGFFLCRLRKLESTIGAERRP
jgi:16S rRNA C967 or C1407 C5-methylase (RsmB/RsmF family)